MKAVIYGVGQPLEGISKKNGRAYKGQILHLVMQKKGVEGRAVKELYVDLLTITPPPAGFHPQDSLSLDFDDSGMLQDLTVLAKPQPKQ